jgi:hypothetical protein
VQDIHVGVALSYEVSRLTECALNASATPDRPTPGLLLAHSVRVLRDCKVHLLVGACLAYRGFYLFCSLAYLRLCTCETVAILRVRLRIVDKNSNRGRCRIIDQPPCWHLSMNLLRLPFF